MDLNDLDKLELKVKSLVDNLILVKEENRRLQTELEQSRNQSSVNTQERQEIKKKVETLIELIDSIEK